MTVRVGINGFGRIGRNFFRAALAQGADIEIVGVNDLTDNETLAHLLKYDSILGRLTRTSPTTTRPSPSAASTIQALAERDPARAAVEGARRRRRHRVDRLLHRRRPRPSKHIDAGAKKVIISAPAKDEDFTVVLGVNDDKYDPAKHHDHLQRLLHHQLPGADGQGALRQLRHRARA